MSIRLGIDDFLDHVTVLPPGEWDPKTRIEPPKSVPSRVRMNEIESDKERISLNVGRST